MAGDRAPGRSGRRSGPARPAKQVWNSPETRSSWTPSHLGPTNGTKRRSSWSRSVRRKKSRCCWPCSAPIPSPSGSPSLSWSRSKT